MKKILVVDDSSAIRQSLEFVLKENGFDVITAEDGQDGLSKVKAAKYDLVITDVNMPNMDGITLVKEARSLSDYKFVPILVLTTESQDSKMQEGKAAGATGWIVKPFDNEKLLGTIRKVLPN
ncbi:response regulator [Spirochaeta cellobiosiphila]|uniref:response regulator n=1 Tax=Spirochaeta cellobiosiphila TaxID=504483 RepID=UPI0003F8CD9E|nr:response regulator [Spirochaeta cellobiosiphila]